MIHFRKPQDYFPTTMSFESHLPDAILDRSLPWMNSHFHGGMVRIRHFQHGWVSAYLVYVLIFLVALLVWQFNGLEVLWRNVFLIDRLGGGTYP
jgi:hypothetical protein